MLTVVDLALVNDLAAVDRVLEQVEQAASGKRNAATMRPAGAMLDLGDHALGTQHLDQGGC